MQKHEQELQSAYGKVAQLQQQLGDLEQESQQQQTALQDALARCAAAGLRETYITTGGVPELLLDALPALGLHSKGICILISSLKITVCSYQVHTIP